MSLPLNILPCQLLGFNYLLNDFSPALPVIMVILAGGAVVLAFSYRLWALLAAYASMICMCIAGAGKLPGTVISVERCAFWGIAVLIACGIVSLDNRSFIRVSRALNAYAAGGALTGACLGMAMQPTETTVILGAAIGAFLGVEAHRRIGRGSDVKTGYVQRLASAALPQIVTFSIILLSLGPFIFLH